MELRLRPAAQDDLSGVLELYKDFHPAGEPAAETSALEKVWKEIVARPGLTCVVGEYEGRLVSTCCIAIVPNLTRGGRSYALIENVVTHPDFRRRGFGRAVVRHTLALAWAAGCYKVMLLTGSRRPETHRFYEECGFRSDDKIGFVARPNE